MRTRCHDQGPMRMTSVQDLLQRWLYMQHCICTSATSGHINQSVSKKNAVSAHRICQTVLTTFMQLHHIMEALLVRVKYQQGHGHTPQNVKRPYLKFRLGTNVPALTPRGPHYDNSK